MKKVILGILLVVMIVIIIIFIKINTNIAKKKEVLDFNQEYEAYLEKDLYGIDVVSVINKAMDNNETYHIPRDENGRYIEDGKNSIKVELQLISKVNEKTDEYTMVTHPMERIQEVGLEGFITNFNLTRFQCTTIEYHKETGRVSKLVFVQIEE